MNPEVPTKFYRKERPHDLWRRRYHLRLSPTFPMFGQTNIGARLMAYPNQPCYHVHSTLLHLSIIANTLGPRRNRRHFTDDIFKCIFLNGNVWILIKNSLKFVPKGPINNIPALVQIMAWHLILHIISISLHIHKVNTIPADALSPGHQKPWYQGLLFWCTKNDLISLSVQHIILL